MSDHEYGGTEREEEDRLQPDPVESGALETEQQGKGYGQDEGERDDALPGE